MARAQVLDILSEVGQRKKARMKARAASVGPDPGPVTQLLQLLRAGHREVIPRLVDLVYSELHIIAKSRMQSERVGHTLTPTALVHEAYLRLAKSDDLKFENRSHFLLVAARAMRRILVDHARARDAARRGGGESVRAPIDEIQVTFPEPDEQIVLLDEALKRLAKLSPRESQVVELKYFGGFTDEEIADVLKVTTRTVNRDWQHARAWLHAQVNEDPG